MSDESGWTEREKSLLDRGIEIFGRSALRLAQFVGSRTTAEVRHYLRHFYKDVRATCEVDEDVGSVEEVVGETEVSDFLWGVRKELKMAALSFVQLKKVCLQRTLFIPLLFQNRYLQV